MKNVRFTGTILTGHKQCAVEVPFDPVERWGPAVSLRPGRRGHAVDAVLGGIRFRSAVVARSKRFFLVVEDDVMERAGVGPGDEVRLEVSLSR